MSSGHQSHLPVLFCNHFTISLQGIKWLQKCMTMEKQGNRGTAKSSPWSSCVLSTIIFHPPPLVEEWKAQLSEMKNISEVGFFFFFFWPRRSSETFQDSCCSWLKHCPDWKHQSPQSTPIPLREMQEQLPCHQQNTADFLFHNFSQTKNQSRSYLMIQSQNEIELSHTSYGIIPDSVRQNEGGNGVSTGWD